MSSGQKKDTRSSNVGGTEGGLNPGDHLSRIRLRKMTGREPSGPSRSRQVYEVDEVGR